MAQMTPKKVELQGEKLYKTGKIFMFIGLFSLAFLILVTLISLAISPRYFYYIFLLDASGYEILYPLILGSYIGVPLGILGIVLYLYGMQLFALGRIAGNTEQK